LHVDQYQYTFLSHKSFKNKIKIDHSIPCHNNAIPLRLGTFASTNIVFQKNHEIELRLIKAIVIDRLTPSNSLLPWACQYE
jgi:hypothetical protein